MGVYGYILIDEYVTIKDKRFGNAVNIPFLWNIQLTTYLTNFMFLLFLFVCQVEKNEDADQKIEQDGTTNKPEDKAHKAATKIQASFRGHITRKKMKGDEEEKDGDSPAAADEATEGGEVEKKVNGEEAPAKDEEAAAEEPKKVEETSQAKSPVADKAANSPVAAAASPAATATSPVAAAPAATSATAEPQKEEPKPEEKVEEKPKEVEAPVAAAKSPTTATAEEKKEEEKSEEKKEEARQADVPDAVSTTAEKEETNQTNDKQGKAQLLIPFHSKPLQKHRIS